jgi:hypothetical protein
MAGTSDTNWRSYVGPADNGLTVDAHLVAQVAALSQRVAALENS